MNDPSDCGCGDHRAEHALGKNVSRRDVLRTSLAGAGMAGVYALGPFGRFAAPALGDPVAAKRMVVINMYGGCDTLNMVVPNLSQYVTRRTSTTGNIFVDYSSALSLNGTTEFRLHPSMPLVRGLWNEGSVAAVQRVGYPNANLSHFESQDIFSSGVRNGFGPLGIPESGWLARFADRYAPTALGAVGLGVGRTLDFVGGTSNPLVVNSLASFNISGSQSNASTSRIYRTNQAKAMLARYGSVGLPQQSRDALDQAYQLTNQVQTAITSFTTQVSPWPNTSIANRLRDAAILIQGGFTTRIFYSGFGGFDTHGSQGATTGALPTLLGQLDGAIGAFSTDMKNRGLWNDIAIVVITEFGRRNYVNGSAGTDHGHAFTALVIGGAVTGGVYGDLTDNHLLAEYPPYAIDFRDIYKNVLQNHMAVDPAPVFVETQAINTNLGIF